jgi:GDP-L-fucose synthase
VEKESRIYVAGHRGLLGAALVRALEREGHENLVLRTSGEVDLRDPQAVNALFQAARPDYVFIAAAKVGGILANDTCPVEFLYDNLMIEANLIHAAHEYGVNKLLFMGSTCIYPKMAPQPLKEEFLLTGPLEPTNEWYAVAKIAGIKLCQAYQKQHGARFISAMATNLYGPGDNFDLETSHVMSALIRKFHEAKVNNAPTVEVWGSGTPCREFLYVDDCASACLYLMDHYNDLEIINIGVGKDLSIADLARLVREVVGYEGEIVFDRSKPDGTPRKLVDVTKLELLGWRAATSLEDGIRHTYDWYVKREP